MLGQGREREGMDFYAKNGRANFPTTISKYIRVDNGADARTA